MKAFFLGLFLACGVYAQAPQLMLQATDAAQCKLHESYGFACAEDIMVIAFNLPAGSAAHFTVSYRLVSDGSLHTAEVVVMSQQGTASWGTLPGGDFVGAHATLQVMTPSGNEVAQ